MLLQSIKLSGFKSFVEPTHFQLPGRLVGVVGPNGCGKSNIIDAVRWVLGESKASELRGESMQDVIFNGSALRKPAGRASVELVFDNTLARAGGPWNRFTEIAVRRVLTRDGTSSYSINGQAVRRRDVQDVFLGTGLGPRAYAIIGQGTISRIIESKPEELRLFLEEAAGVSKYKERRRETESRLKDTRENLTRVDDILRELNATLGKLETQAEVAGRYRSLQQEAERKQQQLWFLKARDAAREEARVRQAIVAANLAFEARTAELRQAEGELEGVRQSHYAANDALHAAQGELGNAALAVSRLEERVRYVAEGRERIARQRGELAAQRTSWTSRQADAEVEHARTGDAIVAAEAAAANLREGVAAQQVVVTGLEQAFRAARADADQQRTAVAAVQQEIQVAAAESRGVGERIEQSQARRDRVAAEQRGLVAVDPAELAAAQERASSAAQRAGEARTRMTALEAELPRLDEARRALQAETEAEAARRADLSARLDALQALQQQVQVDARVRPWLERHGLTSLAGLWTRLRIDAGWEAALESALRERMGALEIGRLDTVAAFAADAPPARLAFFTPAAVPPTAARLPLPRLNDRLHLGDAGLAAQLADWLEGVYTAADLQAALRERGVLAHGEVIMTPEGHTVSRSAVSFYAPDSEQAGLLARAQQIEQLGKETRAQSLLADDARARLVAAEAAGSGALARLGGLRRELTEAQAVAHRLEVEAVALTQRAEQTGLRHDQLAGELQAVDAELAELEARRSDSEARFETLDGRLGEVQEEHGGREARVHAAQDSLSAASDALRSLERRAQEADFERRGLHARRDELVRGIEVAKREVAASLGADSDLGSELDRLAASAPGDELDLAVTARIESEQRLGEQRSRYDDLTQRLRSADESRLAHAQALQPLRDKVGTLQLEEQAAQLGGAQYVEQLDAAGADRDAIAAAIEQGGVKLSGLQSLIDGLHREVESLGAVNLAALDELTTGRERKTFLDAQNADLSEAMATLEDAIKKIDRETRELLGTTFDQVNDHFGRMFPQLFGGGTAQLVMTGDEILDSGVQVMAQPPGKKNSSIHLLSGGEKALTAIALVFAIFQLNPAPFCLLDEVDAPLDDANTERYARLVTEMAATTQFLFISHNRIAMEMAEQLIGVTMQEQGVSRIVTVDVPAALQLAEAA